MTIQIHLYKKIQTYTRDRIVVVSIFLYSTDDCEICSGDSLSESSSNAGTGGLLGLLGLIMIALRSLMYTR
jgi:hypothetical protein